MQEFRLNVKLDFKDYLSFQYSIIRKRFFPTAIVLAVIIVFSLLAIFLSDNIYGFGFSSMMMIITYMIIIPGIIMISTYFNAKKAFYNDKFIQKEQVFIFNEECVQIQSESSNVKILWTEIYKTSDTKNNFLIYTSPSKSVIVPKRFLNDNETEILKVLFKEKVFSRKRFSFFKRPSLILYLIYLIIALVLIFKSDVFNSSKSHFEKGYSKEQSGDYKDAIEEYNKAIEEDASDKQAYNFRGHAKGMLRDYQGELNDCSKAIELDEDYGYAYYNRASAKHFLNDQDGACEDYYKADDAGFYEAAKAIEQNCK